MMSVADLLKAREKFEEAEEYYEKAMEADPTWGYPAYQSACNYELWNEHDRAEQQFAKAVELGFNDFPTALTDDELGQIREGSGFNAALLKIRELYVASAKTCVGQPIAFRRISEPREDFSTWVLARRITRNVVDR
jgi:tetratricopeptide (TPR) repeat protein